MTEIFLQPSTWVLISFLCVLGIFFYMGLWKTFLGTLDSRCEGIAKDLRDAEHNLSRAHKVAEEIEKMRHKHQEDLKKIRIQAEKEGEKQKHLQKEMGKRRLERKRQENKNLTLRMNNRAHARINAFLVKIAFQSLEEAMVIKNASQSLALLRKTSVSLGKSPSP